MSSKNYVFWIKLGLFSLIVGSSYFIASHAYLQQNDPYYSKTQYKAHSLILGLSRANQGISPSILKQELALPGKVLNFAFNANLSPYGASYFRALKKKKIIPSDDAIFILSVNVRGVATFEGFHDKTSPLDKLHFFNMSPNFEYLIQRPRSNQALFNNLTQRNAGQEQNIILHQNGWKEVSTKRKGKAKLSHQVNKRFKRFVKEARPSLEKLSYLERSIDYLSTKGKVFLVYLPLSSKMKQVESSVFPDFIQTMDSIARQKDIPFFDFSENQHAYTFHDDIHHLESKSARRFTHELAKAIKKHLNGSSNFTVPSFGKIN